MDSKDGVLGSFWLEIGGQAGSNQSHDLAESELYYSEQACGHDFALSAFFAQITVRAL